MKGFVQAYRKELIYVGIAIILYVIYKVSSNRLRRKLELPINKDQPAPRSGFNEEAEAMLVYEELSGWNTALERRAETFEHILTYAENELRLVHNAYLKLYQNANKKTLASLVRGEWLWTPGEYLGKAKKYRDEILRRLRKLGAA